MSTLPNRFALDLTGKNRDNYVEAEPLRLSQGELRVAAPLYAPFFKSSLIIEDKGSGLVLTKEQYKLMNIVPLPSAMAETNDQVYALIVITDLSVSGQLVATYQTVGGDYLRSYETAADLIATLLIDNRKRDSSWPNILNKDTAFEPSLHFHAIEDVIGWEYVASALEEVKTAILLGDETKMLRAFDYLDLHRQSVFDKYKQYADALNAHAQNFNNPHQVTKAQIGLDKVHNYPVATEQQVSLGVDNTAYVTPSVLAAVIAGRVSAVVADHAAKKDNPHLVNKHHVGLGLVNNYATATAQQMLTGTAEDLYVTPAGVKQVVEAAKANLIPKSKIGAAMGVVPLNASGQIDPIYLSNLNVTGGNNAYDFQQYTPGKPTSQRVLMQVVCVRAFICDLGFSGSMGKCEIPASQGATCSILKNGVSIGTLVFGAGLNYGVFNVSTSVKFAVGDLLTIKAPATTDTALADITIAVHSTLGA